MRQKGRALLRRRTRRTVAAATAFAFLCQNVAWAVCSDGTTFPPRGFVGGGPWSPGVTSNGSIFVPDNSLFENNDPAQPMTGGGHNWVFGTPGGLCKATDIGPAGGTPTAWTFSSADCLILPVIRNGSPVNIPGDNPLAGDTITPTCDPAQYVGGNPQVGPALPTNTYFNHLGCSISRGAATTPQSATTFLFVAGVQSGLFAVPLVNVLNPAPGGAAGKIISASISFYSDIPAGQKLTNAAVSPDGMFAIATTIRRGQFVYACLNPLGDPGDPSQPIDPNFLIPLASQVKCMVVGNNNIVVDQTTVFGPDNQPYFGGQRTVNSFNGNPGGSSATAWPQCIFNGFAFANPSPTSLMGKLQAVFNAHSASRCGNAQPNAGFSAAGVTQPEAILSHGLFMYTGPPGGAVVQIKVTVNPLSGASQYAPRTYLTGVSLVTALGIADDLKSLLVFTDPSGVGTAGREVTVKIPLCEDM